jgi:isoamylase
VSYDRKHNLANGENDRDGDNHNNSWNHGVEGPSSNPAVLSLRERQLRNLLSTLLLAPGVPMLLMGDEVRRSQGGNNNTWCQNNPLGWMHWQPDNHDQALRRFLQRLLALRRQLAPLLNPEQPLLEGPPRRGGDGHAAIPWREWHGVELRQPDWASWSHCLAWSLHDQERGSLLWCGLNAYYQPMTFQLPPCPAGWRQVINTALPADQDLPERPQAFEDTAAALESRSLVLLVAGPLLV